MPDLFQAVCIVFRRKISHAGAGAVREGSTQVLLTNILAGYGFDDFRTGNEHLGALFHHVNEVCQGRAVNSTAGTKGPMMAEICGITPEERVFCLNIFPKPARASVAS